MSGTMRILPADYERHAGPILALLNDAALHTTWTYDCDARPESYMRQYFDAHAPILVAEDDSGAFLGFASCGAFRPHQGYLHAGEHSVYVDPAARRKGVVFILSGGVNPGSRPLKYTSSQRFAASNTGQFFSSWSGASVLAKSFCPSNHNPSRDAPSDDSVIPPSGDS